MATATERLKRVSSNDRDALRAFIRSDARGMSRHTGSGEHTEAIEIELRDLSGNIIPTKGGYAIQNDFSGRLELSMANHDPLRRAGCMVVRTKNGAPYSWPICTDTSEGEIVVENDSLAEDDITFAERTFDGPKFSSKLIRCPAELTEDSDIDLFLADVLGARIARSMSRELTRRLLELVPTGTTAAATTAVTASEWLDFLGSVDDGHSETAASRLMLNRAIYTAARKGVGGDGQFVFGTRRPGEPAAIDGRLIAFNPYMTGSLAASGKTALFGNMNRVVVRTSSVLALHRLDEKFAEFDQIGYFAVLRADINVLSAGDDPVKLLVQAA